MKNLYNYDFYVFIFQIKNIAITILNICLFSIIDQRRSINKYHNPTPLTITDKEKIIQIEPASLTESIYTSGLKSSFKTDLLNSENQIQEEINEEDCEVQITDITDFLSDLKEGNFQYVDMDEVNRRNNTSRFRAEGNKSNVNMSTSSVVKNSRFGGLTTSRFDSKRLGGSILNSGTEGKPTGRKFDLRERLKNLGNKIS